MLRGMDEPRVRLAELLVGLSLIADVGMGLEPGEAARAAVIATRLAADVGAGAPSDVYYTTLLQHVGCTAYAHEAAAMLGGDEIAVKSAAMRTDFARPRDVLTAYLPNLAPQAGMLARLRAAGVAAARSRQIVAGYSRANCEVAALTGVRLGLGTGVEAGLLAVYEQVDGNGGPRRLRGDGIPVAARIAQVAVYASLFDRLGGADLAVATLRRRAGRSLDGDLVEVFCAQAGSLLDELAVADVPHAAVDAEPAPAVEVEAARLDDVCRAFGDVVDLKSPYLHEHAAGVSALAAAAAEWLRMPPDEVVAIRRAGLLHDLGRAAVPNGVWEKEGRLTSAEWERVRLHAYHSERILNACPPLAPLARLAGMHHERLDGSGYHREATGAAMAMPARILAAADAFQAMTQPRPHRPARDPDAAAAVLVAEADAGRLDADAVAAVRAAAGEPIRRRRAGPSGLTDRQIEVLRLLAAGLSNREIGRRLSVSPRTAEHHVQDIYARIGVSTRASAALYAMQQDLLA
jgi:HD-GYP domain-containing protein (c-di-GMP phosphodiesterase class II)